MKFETQEEKYTHNDAHTKNACSVSCFVMSLFTSLIALMPFLPGLATSD